MCGAFRFLLLILCVCRVTGFSSGALGDLLAQSSIDVFLVDVLVTLLCGHTPLLVPVGGEGETHAYAGVGAAKDGGPHTDPNPPSIVDYAPTALRV